MVGGWAGSESVNFFSQKIQIQILLRIQIYFFFGEAGGGGGGGGARVSEFFSKYQNLKTIFFFFFFFLGGGGGGGIDVGLWNRPKPICPFNFFEVGA